MLKKIYTHRLSSDHSEKLIEARAIPELISLLHRDPDLSVQLEAVCALSFAASSGCVEILINHVHFPSFLYLNTNSTP